MQVREDHDAPESKLISFPVLVVRSEAEDSSNSPFLHLGAGGPGAPMYLDDSETIEGLIQGLRGVSLAQGRDLIVIDPRGTGLSRPLLTCDTYVDNELGRLKRSLTIKQAIAETTSDYGECVDRFVMAGIDFNHYNSFAIAKDIEALRRAAEVDQWVLYGISYGGNYAMTIAQNYPNSVESMVLDSSFVSSIGFHEYYLEQTLRPYQMLFDYCSYDPECRQPIDDVEKRFWAIHQALNEKPIWVDLYEIDGKDTLTVLFDGERFLPAIMEGIYDTQIFIDLPKIIEELEGGNVHTLWPYLWLNVTYLLDRGWGDVSGMAHYCYEQKPQIDFPKIKEQFDQLPPGYLREIAPILFDWPDHCEQMQMDSIAPHPVPSKKSLVPTLFLHGNYDSVTPLSNVRKIEGLFEHAHLLIFDLSHGILGKSDCAMNETEKFVKDPGSYRDAGACN